VQSHRCAKGSQRLRRAFWCRSGVGELFPRFALVRAQYCPLQKALETAPFSCSGSAAAGADDTLRQASLPRGATRLPCNRASAARSIEEAFGPPRSSRLVDLRPTRPSSSSARRMRCRRSARRHSRRGSRTRHRPCRPSRPRPQSRSEHPKRARPRRRSSSPC